MPRKRDVARVQEILTLLAQQVALGRIYLESARALQQAFAENALFRQSFFFSGLYDAALREAILAVAKILARDKESITLHYLWHYVENRPALFALSPEDAQLVLAEQRSKLARYNDLLVAVREQRDRVLAHLDRKHLNEPQALLSNPEGVNLDELSRCLDGVLAILNAFGGRVELEFQQGHLAPAIQADAAQLIAWMQAHGQPQDWAGPPTGAPQPSND